MSRSRCRYHWSAAVLTCGECGVASPSVISANAPASPLRDELALEGFAPVLVGRQVVVVGPNAAIARRIAPARHLTARHRIDSLQQELTRGDDGAVTRAQVFL